MDSECDGNSSSSSIKNNNKQCQSLNLSFRSLNLQAIKQINEQSPFEDKQFENSIVNITNSNSNSSDNNNKNVSIQNNSIISLKTKSLLTVVGATLIYFAMGLYFAAGSTGVYLTSYLIYKSQSSMQVNDGIWFLSIAGFSALLLPFGGLLSRKIGVRGVCLIGGTLQSLGVFATYFALDTSFAIVVFVYGGSFLLSLATCYTSPLVNVCKWHQKRQGLVSGICAAAMAVAPTVFTPLITELVNPNNVAPNARGLFDQDDVLQRTKNSTIVQAIITFSLFIVGSALTFEAPTIPTNNSTNNNNSTQCNQTTTTKQQTTCTVEYSIEPKFAFKTLEFWLLSFKVLISELIFIYLLFIYKPYGLTFIADDYFLSTVGAACALSNTIGRLSMGHLKDIVGYKAVSVPLSFATAIFIAALPACKMLDSRLGFATCIVLAVGAVGSQYALMPSATQDAFGEQYASVNIGFVYMSTVVATVSSALLSQHLTSVVGWHGMIALIAVLAIADLLATLCMPSKPKLLLEKRYKQFYEKQATFEESSLKVKCPNCNCLLAYDNAGFQLELQSSAAA